MKPENVPSTATPSARAFWYDKRRALTAEVEALWIRGLRSLASAKMLTTTDPDSAVSRAYYAAFDAVSALFLLEGKSFTKHTGVEAAVHRDMVNTGRWLPDVGKI